MFEIFFLFAEEYIFIDLINQRQYFLCSTLISCMFFKLVFEFFRKNKTRGKISEIFGKISEKLEKLNLRNPRANAASLKTF